MHQKIRRNGLLIMYKLVALLGKLAYLIIFAVLFGYLGNALAMSVMVFGSLGVCKIIDPNFINIDLNILITLTICSGILRGLLRFIEQYSNHYIAFKLLACLRQKIFHTLRKLSPAKLETKEKGNILSMLTSDIETLEVFYAHTISPVGIALLSSITVLILLSFFGHYSFTLITLFSYILIGIVVPFVSSHFLKKSGSYYRNELGKFSSYYLDSLSGIKDILLNNNQKERSEKINNNSKELNKLSKDIKTKSSIANAINIFLVSLTTLSSLFLGVYLLSKNQINLTNLIFSIVLISSSFGPILALGSLPSNLTQTFASGNRILDLFEEKPAVEEIFNKNNFDFDSVNLKNISFSYNNQKVLNNVSLNINKNEIIGIEGDSGSGKSTLLKLILRFYEINNGSIKFNNQFDIKEINSPSLHNNIVLVSQDTYLFDDTILNNLLIAKPNATKEEIETACKNAHINELINSLEDGLNTRVGLLGDRISAGEKQRIGLARAFLSDANLILLDEPTSNVDVMNESIILNSLQDIKNTKTIVLVSHRKSTLSICNKIYKMENGVLINEE